MKGNGTGGHGGNASGASGRRQFISYVCVQSGDNGDDPDGLDQTARLHLEARAIDLILAREPHWKRTPTHNPGFDLNVAGEDGNPIRWCEVKAMRGTLRDRPVGLSRTQFECAQEHGEAYWLYIVENAGTEHARIVRIQDPAGNAHTFTFDHGWQSIAHITDTASSEDATDLTEE